jgi:ERF superfamily
MTDQTAIIVLAGKIAKAGQAVGGKLKADKRNTDQNYAYISADQILFECGQALFDQGVAVIPSVISHKLTAVERPNKSPRLDADVDFVFKVTDGIASFEEPWTGMGSDYMTPDKALYKAITSGHKYFLSKLLCIGEGNVDSEHEDEEPAPRRQATPALRPTTPPAAQPKAEPVSASAENAPSGEQEQVAVVVSLAEAKEITNSEGKRYGDMTVKDLQGMRIGINKKLRGSPMTTEERAHYNIKLQAIDLLILYAQATA